MFFLKLLCVLFSTTFWAKNSTPPVNNHVHRLLAEAKLAMESKNYDLAKEIYSKLPSRSLKLSKLQAVFEATGDQPRALAMAHKRFAIASFYQRLKILQSIRILEMRLGLFKPKQYLPNLVHQKFCCAPRLELWIDKVLLCKAAVTNFGIELLALVLWILFLFALLLSMGKLLTLLLCVLFCVSSYELFDRLVINPVHSKAIVVSKNAKLLSKPNSQDGTVLATLIPGESVIILQDKKEFLKIHSLQSEFGWIEADLIEKTTSNK